MALIFLTHIFHPNMIIDHTRPMQHSSQGSQHGSATESSRDTTATSTAHSFSNLPCLFDLAFLAEDIHDWDAHTGFDPGKSKVVLGVYIRRSVRVCVHQNHATRTLNASSLLI